ncbi:MAG: ABC transporter substrate-binding protein [Treponema sp.]|nr:ABC transporter substrate-binding protein [Treponema sp.]
MKTRRKGLVVISAALIGVLFISSISCSKPKGQESASSDGSVSATAVKSRLKKLIVPLALSGYTTILSVIAKEEGIYEKNGLDVKLEVVNLSGMDLLNAVISGKLDIALSTGSVTPFLGPEEGLDVVTIGGTMTESGALFTTAENAPEYAVLSKAVLTGKTIGNTRVSSSNFAIRGYTATLGLDVYESINWVDLDSYPTIIEAVRKGSLDLGTVANYYRQRVEDEGFKIVKHLGELSPDYICCRIATTRKNIEEDRDRYVKFLKSQIEAYKFFNENHARSLELALKYYELDRDILENEFFDYGHITYKPDPLEKRLLEQYERMTLLGYAKGTLNIRDHIDVSIYQDALQQVLDENPGDIFFLDLKKEFDENNNL